ncbi:MAG TPA: glycosyltransferase [Candidatus Xenobia bacterium]|jgi:GT2 family glycosyltransferase
MSHLVVLIATRNRWSLLHDCLESLQRMHLPDHVSCSIRVVDNGSEEPAWQALQRYARERHRMPVEVQREPIPGKSRALNRGLTGMQADYLAFTDDDMLMDAGWAAAVVSHFEACSCGGLNGRIDLSLPGPAPEWFTDNCAELLGSTHARSPGQALRGLMGGNMAVRAKLLPRIGPFRHDLGPAGKRFASAEDMEWSGRLLTLGERLCFCPVALNFHRIEPFRVRQRYLWWRQFEYSRAETLGHGRSSVVGMLQACRHLAGSALIRRRAFKGFDHALEIAALAGRVWGMLQARWLSGETLP